MFFFRKYLARKGYLKPLVSLLKNREKSVRMAAVEGLAELSNPNAVPPLAEIAILDEWEDIRMTTALALGKNRSETAVAPLKKALQDHVYKVRRAAASSLLRYEFPASLWGHTWLCGEGAENERIASRIELKKSSVEAFYPLRAALDFENWQLRSSAAEILGEIEASKAVDRLCETLHDEDADVRRASAVALGNIKDDKAVEPLKKIIDDQQEDINVRRAAAEAMAKFSAKEGLLGHAWLLAMGDKKQKEAAQNALHNAGDDAMPALFHVLKSGFWSIRQASAQLLGAMKHESAVQPLKDAAGDEDWHVREAVAEALGEIGDPAGFAALHKMLADENWKVRAAAALSIGKLRMPDHDSPLKTTIINALSIDPAALGSGSPFSSGELKSRLTVDPIIAALRDKNEHVRAAAATALGDIGVPSAVEPLSAALKDLNDTVRAAAAGALGKIRDQRAFEPLIGALNDWYSTVCKAAAESLVKLGPPVDIWGHSWLIGGGEKEIQEKSHEQVVKAGKNAVKPLITTLGDWHTEVRSAAAKQLGELKAVEAIEPLCKEAIRTPLNGDFIDAVFKALVNIRQPGTGEKISEILETAMFQSEDRPQIKRLLNYVRQIAKLEWMTEQDKKSLVKAHNKLAGGD